MTKTLARCIAIYYNVPFIPICAYRVNYRATTVSLSGPRRNKRETYLDVIYTQNQRHRLRSQLNCARGYEQRLQDVFLQDV